jgi:DNA-binding MurR/RpiR family transcriptional regulator
MIADSHSNLDAAYEGLAPRLKEGARYVLDHPQEVALYSLRNLAERAGVAPATLSRLARAVGCEDYEAFREGYRRKLTGKHFFERAIRIQTDDQGKDDVMVGQAQALATNIEAFIAEDSDGASATAAELLLAAERVYVLGMMSSFSLAAYAHYVARMALPDWSLLGRTGESLSDGLQEIGPKDALLAFSSEPYCRGTVESCRQARAIGASVVVITDRRSGPLARQADAALVVSSDSPSFFPSASAQMAVLEGLLATIMRKAGPDAVARLESMERSRWDFGEYWKETA